MSGDFRVCVGVAPAHGGWYLRFALDWDDDDQNLVGRFDLTLPPDLIEPFLDCVTRPSNLVVREQDAGHYYQAITR